MNRWLSVVYLTTCLLTWLASLAFAQPATTTLTGSVADATTGKAMPFANVYLNGSTRGTVTNEQGNYSLSGVPLGTVEIVASFVGYQPQQRTLRLDASQNNKANFRLKPSDQTLLTVTVRGNQKKWERHLRQFKRQLLGEPFGGQCLIMNSDVLSFKEENGQLKATASEPLIIENQALGYKLRYDLLYFDGSFKKVYYAGSVHFDELKPADERQAKRFRRNRMIAYKGSTRHLMASLVDGSYEKEGFMVYREDPAVLPMKSIANRIVLAGSVGTDTTKGHLLPLKLNELIQPGRLPFERRLLSDKTLIVFYTNAISVYSPYMDARYAYSEIKLPAQQIQLTTDGTITIPNGMVISGSLSDDRLSTLLPADWQPTKTDVDPVTNAPLVAQGKFLLPDARQKRIAAAFNERFQALAPVLFVHTDKPFYATGDRMWLSSYLLDAVTNRRLLGETAMHVDLLTPSGKLIQHQWLRVTDGRAVGNFRLSDSLATGTYRLRAYTDEDDGQLRPAFERSIAINNLFQNKLQKQVDTDAKPLDVQVLPEGGRWVVGLPARLGIKIVGSDGQGVRAQGQIVTNEGTEVCQLTINAFGMGSFVMTPEAGKKYYADVVHNGQHQLVPLPVADKEGYVFSADVVSDTNLLALTIAGTNLPSMDSVYVLIQQRGRLIDQRKILLQNGVARVSLPAEGFPSGLNQITLYNAAARPQGERLVFIPERLPPLRILVGLNKPRYQPREQAIMSINLSDEGIPSIAALSASITDAGQVPEDTAAATIQTHLLLTGELSGRIEQPNVYVKDNSLETRRALDDLLLTQGWRRVSGTPSTELMGGVSVMGRVLNAKNQPISGAQVMVASTVPEHAFVRSAGTNDKGRFRLAGLEIADTVQLMTQLADHQLKNYADKDAHLILEGPWVSWQLDTTSIPSNWTNLHAQLAAARIRQENDTDLYRDKTAKLLKAVTVRAKKMDERPLDVQRSSLHSEADATLVFDETSPRFANLYEMMRGKLSGVNVMQVVDPTKMNNGSYQVIIRGVGTLKSSSQPLYLVDGVSIQDNDGTALLSFNPGDIERIEVLKNGGTAGIYGVRGGNGVIAFYTKRFRPDQQKSAAKGGMKPLQLIGYASVQREFYMPKYTAETQTPTASDRIDRRDVLYWKPLMQTDSQGHSQLVFPLSDVVRTLRVTLQGITENGRPIAITELIRVQ
ncbi:TonB-dependent receptor plug domain-containing protein [Spirosoma sp. HMF4905]|uniref:TonB-dependent receptor plug domain-containing protein n=1 Tax=Spirosoma arboris TaxID=2682092 RepID=A0A7K1S5H2_9BACT|nr:carboxypeptidase regulatory-like domain-containing protein [Spirosoma arboris]MVM29072.1 TonB-dependent receptor plug domain-containing protein [Spirosoma arboris]